MPLVIARQAGDTPIRPLHYDDVAVCRSGSDRFAQGPKMNGTSRMAVRLRWSCFRTTGRAAPGWWCNRNTKRPTCSCCEGSRAGRFGGTQAATVAFGLPWSVWGRPNSTGFRRRRSLRDRDGCRPIGFVEW